MAITVRIPTPFRAFVGGCDRLEVAGNNVREVVDALGAHGSIYNRICDDSGKVRRFVNLFVNDEDIRTLGGLDAPVKDGDVVSIVPAISGG